MIYNAESLRKIEEKFQIILQTHEQLMVRLMYFDIKLTNANSQVYLEQGVARRLGTLIRCIKNIFQIFPAQRTEKLSSDELADLTINLHAFVVNTAGIFDNLGWVFVLERDIFGKYKEGKLGRRDIGLFNERTQEHLPIKFLEYLQSEDLQTWYSSYSKNYRDALSHRIPLYVPPTNLNQEEGEKYKKLLEQLQKQLQTLDLADTEGLNRFQDLLHQQEQLGQASPFFTHLQTEEGNPVFFHSQVIVDYMTIEELINRFFEAFSEPIS